MAQYRYWTVLQLVDEIERLKTLLFECEPKISEYVAGHSAAARYDTCHCVLCRISAIRDEDKFDAG